MHVNRCRHTLAIRSWASDLPDLPAWTLTQTVEIPQLDSFDHSIISSICVRTRPKSGQSKSTVEHRLFFCYVPGVLVQPFQRKVFVSLLLSQFSDNPGSTSSVCVSASGFEISILDYYRIKDIKSVVKMTMKRKKHSTIRTVIANRRVL